MCFPFYRSIFSFYWPDPDGTKILVPLLTIDFINLLAHFTRPNLKIYYNVCPEQTSNFLFLPRVVTGRDAHSVVSVPSRCTDNASPVLLISPPQGQQPPSQMLSAPTAICKADGSWQVVGQTRCECSPGYIPALKKAGHCTGFKRQLQTINFFRKFGIPPSYNNFSSF